MPSTGPSRMSPTKSVSNEVSTSSRNGSRRRNEEIAVILDSLRSLVRELRLASREAEQQVGVHGAQLHALRQLADGPVSSLTELAERTHTDISSVSVVVSRLVEQGLVARHAAVDDRRRLTIGLTARGRGVVRLAPETGAARLLRAAEQLSDRDVKALAQGLANLVAGLPEHRRDEEG